jgi:hypothetical protein
MPVAGNAPPGNEAPEQWKPYKLWAGDRWKCDGCGVEILSGFGLNPIAIQHETNFENTIKAYGADQFQVNDC